MSSIYKIGDGATIQTGSDRHPYTIVWISIDGKNMSLQEDNFKRIDNNGMSESQEYEYSPNSVGALVDVSLRKDGYYKIVNSKNSKVSLGIRRRYYDFSF